MQWTNPKEENTINPFLWNPSTLNLLINLLNGGLRLQKWTPEKINSEPSISFLSVRAGSWQLQKLHSEHPPLLSKL